MAEIVKGVIIVVDGKRLRRSHDNANGKKAIHMVFTWAHDAGLDVPRQKWTRAIIKRLLLA